MFPIFDSKFRSVFLRFGEPGSFQSVKVYRALFCLSPSEFIESLHVFTNEMNAMKYRAFVLDSLLNSKRQLDPSQWSVFSLNSHRLPYFFANDRISFLDLKCTTKEYFQQLSLSA